MNRSVTAGQLAELGISPADASQLAEAVHDVLSSSSGAAAWQRISRECLSRSHPYAVHRLLYWTVYADVDAVQSPPAAWIPDASSMQTTNLGRWMHQNGWTSVEQAQVWSAENRFEFWRSIVERLGIRFARTFWEVVDLSGGPEVPGWFPGARLNIVDSCFTADPDATAIVTRKGDSPLSALTYRELESLVNRVANALVACGFRPGDAIAIDMPMTVESVAAYLGIIRAGCVAVSIADSLAAPEIAVRLRLSAAKAVVTQDRIGRGGKWLPLYEKLIEAGSPPAFVFPADGALACELRSGDLVADDWLSDNDRFLSVEREPGDFSNILFSSGTTGDPKTIPWTHTTPIKCAADGYLYHDVQPGDRLAWPTNLGWMMGPWLVYASLINRGTMGLFAGAPTGRDFGRFVQDSRITMLGVIPSLVKSWRGTACMEGLDWECIKAFSSTGECSNPDDMLYLASLAGYRPIIEYCGGTEIGGGYIASTLLEPNVPSVFNTPAFGLRLHLLDEQRRAADCGELLLEPPSIGLSTRLLHGDHHAVYYDHSCSGPNGELLRRHGDRFERLGSGNWRALGRHDDTMNLGGIKVGSAEIERALNTVPEVRETAAVAVQPHDGGPSGLWIFAVLESDATIDEERLTAQLRHTIRTRLNPLFKIETVRIVAELPRTASNKVMRRVLRDSAERETSPGSTERA